MRPGLKTLLRHGPKVVAALGLWLLVVVQAGAATDTPDAHQDGTSSSNSLPGMAQTFKAQNTGPVSNVSLFLGIAQSGTRVNGTIKITGVTTGGQPDESTVLGTYNLVNFGSCCTWTPFTFAGAGLTAGSNYAIVIRTTPSNIRLRWWDNNSSNVYPDGGMFLTSSSTWSPANYDFAFRVFVAGGSSNSAPTIGASSPQASANEGSVPTNTGSFSDADGDNVRLFPSVGTVTKTSGTASNGNWTWRGVAADEGPTSFVTITAEDGNGGTAFTTFSVTITPVAPTAWIRNAPTSADEGSTVTLGGYGTSPIAEDTAGPWTYAWSVTKNGDHYGTDGSGATYTFPVDDDGAFVVTLVATDDGGISSLPKSVSISGHNLPPTAAITGVTTQTPLVMITRQELTFSGQFTDPGVLDTHTAIWDFGDGSTTTQTFGPGGGPTTFSTTHQFATARTYPVTLTVRDKDGGSASATQNVTIQTIPLALSAISGYVDTRNDLSKGEKNSLEAKLNAASASFQRGNTNASCNQLNAFLNELDARTKTGNVNPDDSGRIAAATRAIQLSMGCFADLTSFLSGL